MLLGEKESSMQTPSEMKNKIEIAYERGKLTAQEYKKRLEEWKAYAAEYKAKQRPESIVTSKDANKDQKADS